MHQYHTYNMVTITSRNKILDYIMRGSPSILCSKPSLVLYYFMKFDISRVLNFITLVENSHWSYYYVYIVHVTVKVDVQLT